MSHRTLRKIDFASRKEASFLNNSIVSLHQLGYFTVNLNCIYDQFLDDGFDKRFNKEGEKKKILPVEKKLRFPLCLKFHSISSVTSQST